ncbi:MAG: recombinase family protein, partial [Chloroflexi bacterium]|nr:recombinase family protein [Chloroflexota bacterium]
MAPLQRAGCDPVMAPLVRDAFELYATGEWPLHRLQQEMSRRGLRTRNGLSLSRANIARLLKNKAYVGVVRWGEVEHPGIHEPLVSSALFEKVQGVLALHNKSAPRVTKHEHYLRG